MFSPEARLTLKLYAGSRLAPGPFRERRAGVNLQEIPCPRPGRVIKPLTADAATVG